MYISIRPLNELDQFILEIRQHFPNLGEKWELSAECYQEVLNYLHLCITNNPSYERHTIFYEYLYTVNQALIESEPLRFEAGEGIAILVDHQQKNSLQYNENDHPPFRFEHWKK